jgi:hypothetical protein
MGFRPPETHFDLEMTKVRIEAGSSPEISIETF